MKWLHTCVVYYVIGSIFVLSQENNVCRNWSDYRHIKESANCWYNPDVSSSVEKIALRHGYSSDKHSLKTEDGYLLALYRISNRNFNLTGNRQPVILQYGIAGAPEFWMLRGKKSLAFVLGDYGYDVWVAVIRGGLLTKVDEKSSRRNPEYWNYSFHEMGIYDVTAMVKYVSDITNQKPIYIGHSMGTTMSYVYAIENPEHAKQYLKGIVALAPVLYLPSNNLFLRSVSSFAPLIYELTNTIGLHVIGQEASTRQLIFSICSTYPGIIACQQINKLLSGDAEAEEQANMLPLFMSFYPTSTTLKTLNHYAQIINSRKFQKYDYGPMNKNIYNLSAPPQYDIDKIAVPVHFFVGTNDRLSTVPNTLRVYRRLKRNGLNPTIHAYDYSHNDYFIGKHYCKFHQDLLNVLDDLSK